MVDTIEIRTDVETVPVWTLMLKGDMRWLLGRRVEIPAHYDVWMRGARYGVISCVTALSDRRTKTRSVYVRMDNTRVRKRVRVPSTDFEHLRFL